MQIGMSIEQFSLRASLEKQLVCVLPVNVDETITQLA
jgi:hypothetical protein